MTTAVLEPSISTLKQISLHEGQSPIFDTDARFTALIAGTGGGKTYTGPWWLAKKIQEHPDGIFGIGSPTYPMLSRTTIPTLIAAFEGTNLQGEYKLAQHIYELPTGGKIYCWSTDNPNHIEGGQYRAIWLDEAGQMKAWVWTVIQARLGFYEGDCLFTTTPYALNWFYTDIYLRAKAGDPNYFVSQFASIKNPEYPIEEYERAKDTMDERTFALRYMGEFRRMQGLVWPDFEHWVCQADEFKRATEKFRVHPTLYRHVGGIDWGYNNPFVALSGWLDDDDVLWLDVEHYAERKLLGEHAAVLDPQCEYWADPSGLQQIQELRAKNLNIKGADNDVAIGIERVTQRGKSGRLKISPECRNLISESETYHYNPDTEKPVKESDHCADAMRYLIMGLDGGSTPSVVSLADVEPTHTTEDEAWMSEDSRIWTEVH